MKRHPKTLIITSQDVKPSRPDFQVDGVMNAAVTEFEGQVLLLLRVAESVKTTDPHTVAFPLLVKGQDDKYELGIKRLHKVEERDRYDFSDARFITSTTPPRSTVYLTSFSHLRIARSRDGVHFQVDDTPSIFPEGMYETWGIEDPRITKLDGWYYINYTAVSELGAATALVRTSNFQTYERLGIIFPPENKDVSIFPEKIGGKYVAYHRPVPNGIGTPNMWVADSDDLIHWGRHRHLLSVSLDNGWEDGRIGGGAPSFKTDKGWVHIYHAADEQHRYCLGAFLTDLQDPGKIIAKTDHPILAPEEDFEMYGFFGNVIFTCGVLYKDEVVSIYYGAADQSMALAKIGIHELFAAMGAE